MIQQTEFISAETETVWGRYGKEGNQIAALRPVPSFTRPGEKAPELLPGTIIFSELFGNESDVEVEIGCGKAKFLLLRAEACPEINFLGIDRVSKWWQRRRRRCERSQIRNIYFMREDSRQTVFQMACESVSVFHIYFPDPWPKHKHRKRRLVNAEFLSLLYGRLRRGGSVQIGTDDADYFGEMKKAAGACGVVWSSVRESVNQRLFWPEVKTNYEARFEALGRNLYYLELKR